MFQDIYPFEYDNRYEDKTIEDGSLFAVVRDRKILVKREDSISLPSLREADIQGRETVYLFSVGGTPLFWLPDADIEKLKEEGYEFIGCQTAARCTPKWLGFACAVAIDLCSWYMDNRYCGRCGCLMHRDGRERMMRCEKCGNTVYPRINPAVITAVTDGDRILLTQYKGRTGDGRYALVAGFAEIGESIEDTVRREVKEETGVSVSNIRFYKSQQWPMSSSLLFGFVCDLEGSDKITIEEDELGDAVWFSREEIPDTTEEISLTSEMISMFKEGKL